MTYVLGINGAYHEPAACLLRDGEIVAAVEEERLNRRKHGKPSRFSVLLPWDSLDCCLNRAGIGPEAVSHIGYSLVPHERVRNSCVRDATSEEIGRAHV